MERLSESFLNRQPQKADPRNKREQNSQRPKHLKPFIPAQISLGRMEPAVALLFPHSHTLMFCHDCFGKCTQVAQGPGQACGSPQPLSLHPEMFFAEQRTKEAAEGLIRAFGSRTPIS